MALTLVQLAAAMRLGDGETAPPEPLASVLTRHLGVAIAWVEEAAPGAPAICKDESAIRMASYLYDAPPAAPGMGFANAWRNSGAALLVSRWRVIRAELGEERTI